MRDKSKDIGKYGRFDIQYLAGAAIHAPDDSLGEMQALSEAVRVTCERWKHVEMKRARFAEGHPMRIKLQNVLTRHEYRLTELETRLLRVLEAREKNRREALMREFGHVVTDDMAARISDGTFSNGRGLNRNDVARSRNNAVIMDNGQILGNWERIGTDTYRTGSNVGAYSAYYDWVGSEKNGITASVSPKFTTPFLGKAVLCFQRNIDLGSVVDSVTIHYLTKGECDE